MWKLAIMNAAFRLTKGDPTEPVSFAMIAYGVADSMGLDADSHDRGGIYNKVVEYSKDLIKDGLLRYEKESIAGHPAMICLNIETGVKRKQPTLFDIMGEEEGAEGDIKGVGVVKAEIKHDLGCAYLLKTGPCDCDPEVEFERMV